MSILVETYTKYKRVINNFLIFDILIASLFTTFMLWLLNND